MVDSHAIKSYLNEFYEYPNDIEQFKLELLKDHFFDKMNRFLNTNRSDFLIGVNKNRDIIFFTCKTNKLIEIIYHYKRNEFYKKVDKNITIINIDNNEKNNNIYTNLYQSDSNISTIEKYDSKISLCNNKSITSTYRSNENDIYKNNTCNLIKKVVKCNIL